MSNFVWHQLSLLCLRLPLHSLRFVVCFFAVFLLFADDPAFGDNSQITVEKRFLSEYPKAAEKLTDWYSHVRLKARMTKSIPGNSDAQEQRIVEFSSSGRLFSAAHMLEGDADESAKNEKALFLATADERIYLLKRFPRTEHYVISASRLPLDEVIKSVRTEMLPAFVAYCIGEETVLDVISNPRCKVLEVVEELNGNISTVKVSHESIIDFPDSPTIRKTGSFALAPNYCWALVAYDFTYESLDGNASHGYGAIVEYDRETVEMPLIKKVVFTRHENNQHKIVMKHTYEILELVPGSIPESEFTLSAYGIDNPVAATTLPWRSVFILLNCALILFFIAWVVKRRNHSQA